MARTANLLDVSALEILRAALGKYGEASTNALYSADNEVRRSQDELVEKTKYWQRELLRRQEDVQRAKSALAFAKSIREGKSTGASEQEIALKKAQARLQEAEEKLKACNRWKAQLPDILREYEARVRQLNGFLETELPKAHVFLKGRATALEKYLATIAAPPAGAALSSGGGSAAPIAAPADAPADAPAESPGDAPATTESPAPEPSTP